MVLISCIVVDSLFLMPCCSLYEEMAEDIENLAIEMVKHSQFYSIQLDESTDVGNKALLHCFVRVECEGKSQEEVLSSLNLPGSFGISIALDSYFLEHRIEWEKYISISTVGAAIMTRHRSGVVAKVKNVSHPDIKYTHCIMHRKRFLGGI